MPQFHFKALGYEEIKNPDKRVSIEIFSDAKKLYLGGRVTHLYVNNNQNISSNIINSIGVSESEILIGATIPFQSFGI